MSACRRLSSRTEEVQDGQIQKPLNWLQNDINWTSNVVKTKGERTALGGRPGITLSTTQNTYQQLR